MADETSRDVVVKIALKQMQTRLDAPDVTPVQKAYDKIDKQIEQVNRSVEELSKSHLEMVDQNIKVADSLKMAGDGAFTLARGLAFIGASTEDDFQKALQTIAKVQGAYDIFKGIVDVTKGIAEARKALMIASNPATTAEALHAAAIKATTVATAGYASTVNALVVSLGKLGVVLGGVGGVVWLYQYMETAGNKHAQREQEAIQRREKTIEQLTRENALRRMTIEDQQKRIELDRQILGIRASGELGRIQMVQDPSWRQYYLRKHIRDLQQQRQELPPPIPGTPVTVYGAGGTTSTYMQPGGVSPQELERSLRDQQTVNEQMIQAMQALLVDMTRKDENLIRSIQALSKEMEDTNVKIKELETF